MKRILVSALIALGILALGSATPATATPRIASGDWACVALDALNLGVCQGNPLPRPAD